MKSRQPARAVRCSTGSAGTCGAGGTKRPPVGWSQSPEAMRQLAAVRGPDFDRLFVRMMTEHHQGAIEMATNLLTVGSDLTLNEFANAVATEQTVEIDRMREILGS
ncbi:hypothetical protein DLJ59_06955 [Micromonospora inaquosa]|uniref:DUF305 domain-containing protein n=2 Tax=Micromonospora inaquosa TaxID=2203716 RepID=A0A3N9WXU5_9ACTN|nr:hypothetical protein DLJ59_06955 [Micromonospora inaquosa]